MRSPGFSAFSSFAFGGGIVGPTARGFPAEVGGAPRLSLGGAELGGGLELGLAFPLPRLSGLDGVDEDGIRDGGGFGFRTLLLLLHVRDQGGSGARLARSGARAGTGGG